MKKDHSLSAFTVNSTYYNLDFELYIFFKLNFVIKNVNPKHDVTYFGYLDLINNNIN